AAASPPPEPVRAAARRRRRRAARTTRGRSRRSRRHEGGAGSSGRHGHETSTEDLARADESAPARARRAPRPADYRAPDSVPSRAGVGAPDETVTIASGTLTVLPTGNLLEPSMRPSSLTLLALASLLASSACTLG